MSSATNWLMRQGALSVCRLFLHGNLTTSFGAVFLTCLYAYFFSVGGPFGLEIRSVGDCVLAAMIGQMFTIWLTLPATLLLVAIKILGRRSMNLATWFLLALLFWLPMSVLFFRRYALHLSWGVAVMIGFLTAVSVIWLSFRPTEDEPKTK